LVFFEDRILISKTINLGLDFDEIKKKYKKNFEKFVYYFYFSNLADKPLFWFGGNLFEKNE
jgi:hypothetical protein